MKTLRSFLLALGVLFTSFGVDAQTAKKPIIMIVPSDNWCTQRYFTQTFKDQGRTVRVSDYGLAFQEDTELGGVISKVGEILTGLGYELKDCEQELKNISMRSGEDNATISKSGAILFESPIDELKRRAKADIILQVGWQEVREKEGKSISFTLEAFDAYTSKRIASSSGLSEPSTESVPRILQKCIKERINVFDEQMLNYFCNLQTNGREIILTVRVWDDWGNDLETEYNGEELLDCIKSWLNSNTVNGAFNLLDASELVAQFEQVRIPFFDKDGKAIDARDFATLLRKHLKKEYAIDAKVMTRGLGEAILIIGEK